MIPYIPQPYLDVAGFRLYAFGGMVALAILTGLVVFRARMIRRGEPSSRVLVYCAAVVGFGLILSHTLKDLAFAADGSSGLLDVSRSIWSFGGLAGGTVASLVFFWAAGVKGEKRWLYLDSTAIAFTTAWIFGRGGCSLAHDHIGRASQSIFAVAFPEGPRFELGMIEAVFTIFFAALLHYLDRRPRMPGFFWALFLVVYGPFRLWLDTLRETPVPQDQAFALLAFAAGTWFFASQWGARVQQEVRC